MSMQNVGGWFDDISSWFGGGGASTSTDYPSSGLIDWSTSLGGGSTSYPSAGQSDMDAALWQSYANSQGTLPNDQTYTTQTGNFFTDLSNGAGDFFNGLTSSLTGLGGLFNTGLEAYARVQALINQTNPQDKIITIPGRSGAFVDKGGGNILPIEKVYPSLLPEIDKANSAASLNKMLIFGALGLGLVLILKKK